MFDVLVFVYEHYWEAEACPELPLLGRRLSAAGFEGDEIEQALDWLEGLDAASKSADIIDIAPKASATSLVPQSQVPLVLEPSSNSLRIYSQSELNRLGGECLGFLQFLESAGVMPCAMREIVLERSMASPVEHVALDDFKIIILMVYWSFGIEPDVLVLDELCDDEDRICH